MVRALRITVVTAYVFTNVLFTPDWVRTAFAAPSPDFWRSRSMAAAVPAMPANMPAVGAVLANRAPAAASGSPLAALLAALSKDVTVRSVTEPKGRPSIIFLQDVHRNVEAQRHVGAALKTALDTWPSLVVGVEAADRALDFSPFRKLPDAAARREIADALVRTNLISGVSWAGLESRDPSARIAGVDDAALYKENLDAFVGARTATADGRQAVAGWLNSLESRRGELSPDLNRLYDAGVAYRRGAMPVGAYLKSLLAVAPARDAEQIPLLMEALGLESRIAGDAAQQERNRFIEAMSRDAGAMKDLASLAAAQARAALDPVQFHLRLCEIGRSHKIDPARFPAFASYVHYLSLADRLDQEKLFNEIRALSRAAGNRAAKTEAERSLYSQLRHARLAERLANFELTPDEWAEYAADATKLPEAVAQALAPYEKFFASAHARDAAMADKIASLIEKRSAAAAVVVAGGFHSPGVRRLLSNRGYGIAIATPRLTSVDVSQGSAYLNSFLEKRAPLADLFKTERLTLADAAQLLGAPGLGGRAADAARNADALLTAYAAGRDGVVTTEETEAVSAAAGLPEVRLIAKDGQVTVEAAGATADIGPNVAPTDGSFENTLGQKRLGIEIRGGWFQWGQRRMGAAFAALAVLSIGANGGGWAAFVGTIVVTVGAVLSIRTLYRLATAPRPDNSRIVLNAFWERVFTWFPVRLYINGTGRTGIPNLLIGLHTPGYNVVAVNGLENNDDGTTKLEEVAALMESDELFGDYGPYRVRVVAAGRALMTNARSLDVTRNERSANGVFSGSVRQGATMRQRFRIAADRRYANSLIRRLDRLQPDWRQVWATEANPDGEARLEWLDIEVNGQIKRVLFFNARGERSRHFPARALNIVGLSETSGTALERRKIAPYLEGTNGGGAQIAVLGAPPKNQADEIPLLVMGVNHDRLAAIVDVVLSNCSCTTNGGVPLLFALSAVPQWLGGTALKLLRGHLTTAHGPTVSEQTYIDVAKAKLGSASGGQTLPTTTGFLDVARPVLQSAGVDVGPISAISFRVPANPSEVGLAVDVEGRLTIESAIKTFLIAAGVYDPQDIAGLMKGVNEARAARGEALIPPANVLLTPREIAAARQSPLKGIIVLISDPVSASSRFVQADASTVLNLAQLSVRWDEASNETRVNLYSWYSNEWGYARRTLEALRAFAIRHWQILGLKAFFRHVFRRELPATKANERPAPAKKKSSDKAPSTTEVPSLPSFIVGAAGDIRPTVALAIDGGDPVQMNRALLYVWNYLRGDRSVDLRAVAGLPQSPDVLQTFAKMLKRPTGYDPLPGRWSLLMPHQQDASGTNELPYPVLRYYEHGDQPSPTVEIAFPASADELVKTAAPLAPVAHILALTQNVSPAVQAFDGISVIFGSESQQGVIAAPGQPLPPAAAGARRIVRGMSGRSLAGYHLAAALQGVSNNRIVNLTVKQIVFSAGEKPVLDRLRSRRAEGNIQMQNLSDEASLREALRARGLTADISGQTDVVNNQNGSIVQLTATFAADVTADDIKAAVAEQVRQATAGGYRVVALSGKEQIFTSDSFAGRPAIFINLDSIMVNGARQVTISAWFDDRMADLNGLNEIAGRDYFAPITGPIVDREGPVATRPLRIRVSVTSKGVFLEDIQEDRGGRYATLKRTDINTDPITIRAGLPLLTRGINDMEIDVPEGSPIVPVLVDALRDAGNTTGVTFKREWSIAAARLQDLPDRGRWAIEIFDQAERAWDGDFAKLPSLFDAAPVSATFLSWLPVERLIEFADFSLRLYGRVTDDRRQRRISSEMLGYVQREILRRIAAGNLPQQKVNALSIINAQIFTRLVAAASSWGTETDYAFTELIAGMVEGEKIGLPYGSQAWNNVQSETWAQLKGAFASWIDASRLSVINRLEGGISFVPAFGHRNFRRMLTLMFDRGISLLGQKETHAWVYGEAGGPAIAALWKALDGAENTSVRDLFYQVVATYAMDPNHLSALLDFASEDQDLEPRVLAFLAVIHEMMRWNFIDREMPFAYLNYVLTNAKPESLVRFRRMLAKALLSRAPLILGLPRDGDLKDFALTTNPPPQSQLYADVYDLDNAIYRQVAFIGIDKRAADLVESRFDYWRTGNPAAAIRATELHARGQTATWRAQVQPTSPRPAVAQLFALIAQRRGVAPSDVPTSALADLTVGDLAEIRDAFPRGAFPDDELDRLFRVEIPLYLGIVHRYDPVQESMVLLRALSASDIRINSSNLDSDVYDIERLVHHEVHHGTGQHTLALVAARFQYWRTGDVSYAVDAAARYAPRITRSWRENPEKWLSENPTAAKSPEWFRLVRGLFDVVAQIRGVRSDSLRPEDLLGLDPSETERARRALLDRFPGMEGEVDRLFEREIRLFQLLRSRYDPVQWEAAVSRIRAAGPWPVDVAPLLQAIERDAPPLETLDALIALRRELNRFLLGNPAALKYKEMGEPDYSYQHGIRGVYGFSPSDPYYRAIQLDLMLHPIETRVLAKARDVVPNDPAAYGQDGLQAAAGILARAIDLVATEGWATQPLRNLADMLRAPSIFQDRLALLCERILRVYDDIDHRSDRQVGAMIDSIARVLGADTISEELATSLRIRNQDDYERERLRLRTHVQGGMLRDNIPLFFVKDVALIVRNLLVRAAPVATPRDNPDTRPVVFFPRTMVPGPEIEGDGRLDIHSEKGRNLYLMSRDTLPLRKGDKVVQVRIPIPPGVIYPIGMSLDTIHERVWDDIESVIDAIRRADLDSRFGDGQAWPVLWAIRSGAIFDAPGQQDTVTNWGITERNVDRVAARIGAWSAWDSLRRYYQEYGMAVHRLPRQMFRDVMEAYKEKVGKKKKAEFTADEMKEVARLYKQAIIDRKGADAIPDSADDQLREIIKGIQRSWDDPAMKSYRQSEGMTNEEGTAIVIQAKVHGDYTFGDKPGVSGAGAAFLGVWPWDEISGSFSDRAEGTDIADGVITPGPISALKTMSPALWEQLSDVMRALHQRYGTKIECEYTIENGNLWILQVRTVPEEVPGITFDAASVAGAQVLSDGYALSGSAVVGPLLSLGHLRNVREVVEGWIEKQADPKEARRGFVVGDERQLAERLRKISYQLDLDKQSAENKSLLIVARAIDSAANLRALSPENRNRIGLIVGSDEAVPEDLPTIRYLRDLSKIPMVVGSVSNLGGPGTHEQENAINLKLTAMAGTSQGPNRDKINFGPKAGNKITFFRAGKPSVAVEEGDVVSLGRSGTFEGKQFAELYLGALEFRKPDSILGNGYRAATRVAPPLEESVFRFLPLTLFPIAFVAHVAPAAVWLTPAIIPLLLGTFLVGAAFSILAHAAAHAAADGRDFFRALPYRLGRASVYTLRYFGFLLPALPAIGAVSAVFLLTGAGATIALPAIQSLILTAAGLRALVKVTSLHAANNRRELARRAVENFVAVPGASAADKATAVAFLRAQGLETLKLSEWTRSQPLAVATDAWTPFTAAVDASVEVGHFDLADIEAAAADPSLSNTDAFRRTLSLLVQLASKKAAVLTISPNDKPENALARLSSILRDRGADVDRDALGGLVLDRAEKANPFAVAERYKGFIGGRRLRAMPLQVLSLGNWELTDFLRNADGRDVLVEIIRLATGDSLVVSGRLLNDIAAAALIRTQA